MDDERTPTEPFQPLDEPQWLTPNAPDRPTTPLGDIPPIEPLPKRHTALIVGIAGALLVIGAAAAIFFLRSGETSEGAVALSYSLEPGSTRSYRMTMSMDGTVDAMAQQIPLDVTVGATVTQEVISVDDQGVATVEMRVEDLQIDSALLGAPSDLPQPEPVRMKIHPDGRIETEGGTLIGSVSPGGLVPGGDQLGAILPEGEVEPGDTWTKEVEVPLPFEDGETLSYTTQGRERGADRRDHLVVRGPHGHDDPVRSPRRPSRRWGRPARRGR
jgi:hypothetical protein